MRRTHLDLTRGSLRLFQESEGMDNILRGWSTIKRVGSKAKRVAERLIERLGVKGAKYKVFVDGDPKQPDDAWGQISLFVLIPDRSRRLQNHLHWPIRINIESSKIPTGGEDKKGGPLGRAKKITVQGGSMDGGDITSLLKRSDPHKTTQLYYDLAATRLTIKSYESDWKGRDTRGYGRPVPPIYPFIVGLKAEMKKAGFQRSEEHEWGATGRYAFADANKHAIEVRGL